MIEESGTKCYVVNSDMSGKGLTMDKDLSVTDGLLDLALLNRDLSHIEAAAERFLHANPPKSGFRSFPRSQWDLPARRSATDL